MLPGHILAKFLLQFPLELGFLAALNHCVALLGAMKPFSLFCLWKDLGPACLGILQ